MRRALRTHRTVGRFAAAAVAAVVLAGCGQTGAGGDATEGGGGDGSAAPESAMSESPESPETSDPSASSAPSPDDSDGDEADGGEARDDAGDDTGDAIEIEIEGDRVEPNGRRVEVQVGEPVRLSIESDRAGELHVHSSPEQYVSFGQGEKTVELTIDKPGVVDVEEHDSGAVVLQLEVR